MPCFHQQLAVPMPGKTRHGKTPFKFIGKAKDFYTRYQSVAGLRFMPCRQCIGCRLEKSRQWATRLLHETPKHANACFLTLTYDDEHVPVDRSLKKAHLQTFFNDFRERVRYHYGEKIKYFACGEYGCDDPKACRNWRCSHEARPHYHAALYGPIGCDGEDDQRVEVEPARSGARQFIHSDFAATWEHGRHRFSELSFESAAYVARYVLKKINGVSAPDHYGDREPEFQLPSKGLGKGHVEDWLSDIYPADHVVLPGRGSFLPPPYYDRLLEKADPDLYARVKQKRAEASEEILSPLQFLEEVYERDTKERVRTLVTEQTLIRSI